jgi:hypothetical protein
MLLVVSLGVGVGFARVLGVVVGGVWVFGRRLRRRGMILGRIVVLFGRNLIDGAISRVSSTNLVNRQLSISDSSIVKQPGDFRPFDPSDLRGVGEYSQIQPHHYSPP